MNKLLPINKQPFYKVRKLNLEESSMLFKLASLEMSNFIIPQENINEFIIQIILKRMELLNIKINHSTIVLITQLAQGNPGKVVMLLHMISENFGSKPIKLENILMDTEIFGNGFPEDSVYQEFWNLQKNFNGALDNYLDDASHWRSFNEK